MALLQLVLLLVALPGLEAISSHLRVLSSLLSQDADDSVSCAPLTNMGSHSVVSIEVGTPPQRLEVVPDTGSDNVIIASCICQMRANCDREDKCFIGTNRSSTFKLTEGPSNTDGSMIEGPNHIFIEMQFGSGTVISELATEVVEVGHVRAMMNDSVLLMIDKQLDFGGPFEGILGLGLPGAAGVDIAAGNAASTDQQVQPMKGFLEAAGVDRFSICFNDLGRDGVMRMKTQPAATALGSIGTVHWGLDFRGISVGNDITGEVAFCNPAMITDPDQKTACGLIPDSGTSLILGDPHHVRKLYEQLCDEWGRCRKHVEDHGLTLPGIRMANEDDRKMKKYELFQILLAECNHWIEEDPTLSQLPKLTFHVAGADGTPSTFELGANDYVLVAEEAEIKQVAGIFGLFPLAYYTGKMVKVCMPSFGTHDYITKTNGPVWIVGVPLFYRYQMQFDIVASPPSIAFVDEECGECSSQSTTALISRSHGQRRQRSPRTLIGPLRLPSRNLSLPL